MTEIIRIGDLPRSENAHRFDGQEHGASVCLFLNHTRPGHGAGLHRHPYDETFVLQHGEATFTVGDQQIAVSGDAIVVVPAGTPHGFVNSGRRALRMISIHSAPVMETEWLE
jgi:mannose-6-phosphate isomerase-like protein (cupin superfamily)